MGKNIFIDLQFLQTGAYERGMGRYFQAVFLEMAEQAKGVQFHCLYSSRLPSDNIDRFNELLTKLKLARQVTFASLNLQSHDLSKGNYDAAFAANRQAFTEYYKKHGRSGDVWLVPSLMQEPAVPAYPDVSGVVKATIWFDLMPYLMSSHYFPDQRSAHARSYLKRLNLLPALDCIFSISTASKNDLIDYLSIQPDRITVIDGAANSDVIEAAGEQLPPSAKKPFFLCPASPEPNKNIINTLKGFGKFNLGHNSKYQLVITSDYDKKVAAQASQFAHNVLFTGHLGATELKALYQQSEGLLFASVYEGLGLPILEAVRLDKKVVCSNIPVFEEMQADGAFYWCNPDDPQSIAGSLEASIQKKELSPEQVKIYAQINDRYSWQRSASKLLKVLDKARPKPAPTLKIAVIGPHPASFSAIAKVIAETYPYLADRVEMHYYYDSGPSDQRHGLVHFHYLQEYTHLYPIEQLPKNASQYGKIIYHIGNSDHHMKSYLLTRLLPGTVVLHDTDLSGKGLAGQMFSNGYLSRDRLALETKVETQFLQKPERFITSLVSSQPRVITHSAFAHKTVQSYSVGTNKKHAVRSNLPINTVQLGCKQRSADDPIRLGIAGIVHDVKGVGLVEWLLEETNNLAGCELVIFGFGFFADKPYLLDVTRRHSNVEVHFDLSDFNFRNLLASLDVLVNYRTVYKGEASRSTLEAMREGVVPILRNVGWYEELPDSACFKLDAIEELPVLLRKIGRHPEQAREQLKPMVSSGQQLLKRRFSFENYAKDLLED